MYYVGLCDRLHAAAREQPAARRVAVRVGHRDRSGRRPGRGRRVPGPAAGQDPPGWPRGDTIMAGT